MIDRFGRDIHYLRLSVTDRCNLRCRYCMPNGIQTVSHADVLRYDEMLRLVRLFSALGVRHVRVTGGEPLVRRDVAGFIAELKCVEGIDTVSLTTNGVLLLQQADALKAAGLDAVNISLDTTDDALSEALTGRAGVVPAVRAAIERMRALDIPVKLNAVLLGETASTLTEVVRYAEEGIPVRLIERMPMGHGRDEAGLSVDDALQLLRQQYPDLYPVDVRLGSGPAHYYASRCLQAPVGLIDAVSHRFCSGCNRVRLTSMGVLKPCLCFEEGVALGALLRGGATDEQLLAVMRESIFEKPLQHCFEAPQQMTETKLMSEIGG